MLEDADPDILEKKRAELQKELELQLKMETVRKPVKELVRKRKKVQRSSSSSSSSSSDSGSSSDSSSSSSSKESRRKIRKNKAKRRNSSSSSDGPRVKKAAKSKRVCHKKLDANKLKAAHAKKLLAQQGGATKIRKQRSQSPGTLAARKRAIAVSPSTKLGHKLPLKGSKLCAAAGDVKHSHRMREVAREKEREIQQRERDRLRERDRERERHRSRDKERVRSRTPKLRLKSRTPPPPMKRLSRSRDIKHKSPLLRRPPSKPRSTVSGIRRERSLERLGGGGTGLIKKDLKRHDSRERDQRDRRDRERDLCREKERPELLVRCADVRPRDRDRLDREKPRKLERDRDDDRPKTDRLLPRPAERAMALAAARDRSRDKSDERDRPRSHSRSARGAGERSDREKDAIPMYERGYDREDPRAYDHIRRLEKDERPVLRDERDYVVVRRREDSRGDPMDSPYHIREKRSDREDMLMDRDVYGHSSLGAVDRYDDHLMRDDRSRAVPLVSSGTSTHGDYISRSTAGGSGGYVDRTSERERDWMRENEMNRVGGGSDDRMYDRHSARNDWDRGDLSSNHQNSRSADNYADSRDWSGMNDSRQWDASASTGNWQQEADSENWDTTEDKEWQDYHRLQTDKMHHETDIGNQMTGGNGGGGRGNRRWTNWRGRRGNQHHHGGSGGGSADYRRQNIHSHQESFPDRSELTYRRHPQTHGQTDHHGATEFSHSNSAGKMFLNGSFNFIDKCFFYLIIISGFFNY